MPLLQTLFVIYTSQLAPLLPVISLFLSWFHNVNTSEAGPCAALERVLELPSHRTARNLHCSWEATGVRNGACRGCGRAETQHSEPMAEARLPADTWACIRALVQQPCGLD